MLHGLAWLRLVLLQFLVSYLQLDWLVLVALPEFLPIVSFGGYNGFDHMIDRMECSPMSLFFETIDKVVEEISHWYYPTTKHRLVANTFPLDSVILPTVFRLDNEPIGLDFPMLGPFEWYPSNGFETVDPLRSLLLSS